MLETILNDYEFDVFKHGKALETAIVQKQFLIYFQPQISILSQKVVGAEALVRYKTSDGILLNPDLFIPILENAGLISFIDYYVFDFVCSKISEWLAENMLILPISTNFSRYTLSEEDCFKKVIQFCVHHKVPHHCLDIEITERLAVGKNNELLKTIKKMRHAGFTLSIDDFGSEHSDFFMLTDARVNTLKIDKGLIGDLPTNFEKIKIVNSIIQVCKKKQVTTIAEGVETQEQFNMLYSLQCDSIQGYMISRPLPYEDFKNRYLL